MVYTGDVATSGGWVANFSQSDNSEAVEENTGADDGAFLGGGGGAGFLTTDGCFLFFFQADARFLRHFFGTHDR